MPEYMVPIVIVICVLAALAAAFVFLSPALARPGKSMLLDRVLGTVVCYQDTRLPWLKCAVVSYARRGRPYQGSTLPMFARKLPRIGAKRTFLLYKLPGRPGESGYWLDLPKPKPEKT